MNPLLTRARLCTRRHFLKTCQAGVGAMALSQIMGRAAIAAPETRAAENPPAPKHPQFPAKAKRIIYLEMAGAPPQQELFDYKPTLVKLNMQPCPDELLKNQRFAFIKGHPKLLGCPYKFQQHGQSGQWVSDLFPNIAGIVDDIAVIRSMNTDKFNHAPADLMLLT